jgi:hypothetical protein
LYDQTRERWGETPTTLAGLPDSRARPHRL